MQSAAIQNPGHTGLQSVYRHTVGARALLGLAALFTAAIFHGGLSLMVGKWTESPDYSHGFLIPLIAVFLLWQRRDELERTEFQGSWAGVFTVVLGLLLFVVGELSTITTLVQYAFLIVVAGFALGYLGRRGFRLVLVPIVLLFFMVPLPNFLYNNLSAKLQLLSSELGVGVIRLFGISVYLEGNVIDLGSYQLQVVEACSGLRYLFPLLTLAFIVTCFFRAPFWQRLLIFLSAAPITVLMNSFRIGAIGIMVERWGKAMAEGFLHDFEGWAIFMVCFAVLFAEMWLLVRLSGERRAFREVFRLELPPPAPAGVTVRPRRLPRPVITLVALLGLAAYPAVSLPVRAEIIPSRTAFAEFPMRFDGWLGQRDRLEEIYIAALKFDDYLLANYIGAAQSPVNLYMVYYASQRKGESAHSPRSCIPGGGWRITEFDQRQLPADGPDRPALRINRALIEHGDERQVVYYWFEQRGRDITNEFMVKWYLLLDALRRNRTDGALVRITTPVNRNEGPDEADQRLARFARSVRPLLSNFIPQ